MAWSIEEIYQLTELDIGNKWQDSLSAHVMRPAHKKLILLFYPWNSPLILQCLHYSRIAPAFFLTSPFMQISSKSVLSIEAAFHYLSLSCLLSNIIVIGHKSIHLICAVTSLDFQEDRMTCEQTC